MKKSYYIVGDTKDYEGCLVTTCGTSEDHAKEILNRLQTNPNENDKKLIEGHTNLRIESDSYENCWWNYGTD